MTHADPGQDREPLGQPTGTGLTTAQIASAGEPAAEPQPAGTDNAHPRSAGDSPAGPTAEAGPLVSQRPRTPLLEPDELESIVNRWRDIQAGFVDEPRRAVKDADALVADLMQRLAQMFAAEREELESRWMAGDDVSTEDLRQGLRRYRSFFERLLAA